MYYKRKTGHYKILFLLFLFLFLILSCGPKVHFIKVGNTDYPSRRKDRNIPVFLAGRTIEKEYRVIGMMFIETETDFFSLTESEISDLEIIKKLKKEAGKYGADALIDLKITSDTELIPDGFLSVDVKQMKRVQAKAVIFVNDKKEKQNNKLNKEPENE